jgi:hypothetical protein
MSRNFGLVGVRLGDAQKDLNLQVSTQTRLDFDGKNQPGLGFFPLLGMEMEMLIPDQLNIDCSYMTNFSTMAGIVHPASCHSSI